MALDFPTSPALNQIYTSSGYSWQWNGSAWNVYSTTTGSQGVTGAAGGVDAAFVIAMATVL